jgi:alkanesulfonate monooxygenase SsuD/methylene tetrahydromethanopterin reductase-like flavin-dependent oxidoreductase (luciferase family)
MSTVAYFSAMDVGLLTLGDLVTDPVTGARATAAERHRSIVEQAVAAETGGFVSIHLGEHHFSDYVLTSPPVVLAAIAERTTTLRLSNGVALAATLDPVRVAEDYGTVDVLSGGRTEPCFGRGTIYPDVATFFGQSAEEATDRFAENVRLIDLLWRSDEPVTWTGRFRAPLVDVEVHPRPVQRPRPPMWLGGGWAPETVDLAVELGCWLMLPTVVGTWEMFRPAVDRYIERWDAAGRDPADRRIGCCSHAFTARHDAAQRWAPRYRRYMEAVAGWRATSLRRAGHTGHALPVDDFDTMCSTVAICGSPDELVDRMGVAAELLDLDVQLLMVDLGGLPHGEVIETIELIGDAVLPQLAA